MRFIFLDKINHKIKNISPPQNIPRLDYLIW